MAACARRICCGDNLPPGVLREDSGDRFHTRAAPVGGMFAAVQMPGPVVREPLAGGPPMAHAGWGALPLPTQPLSSWGPPQASWAPSTATAATVAVTPGPPLPPGVPLPRPLSLAGYPPSALAASEAATAPWAASYKAVPAAAPASSAAGSPTARVGPPFAASFVAVGAPFTASGPPLLTPPAATYVSAPVVATAGGAHAVDRQQAEVCCLEIDREVNAVAVSPDGRRVAIGLRDHNLQVWDLETQVAIHVLRGHKYWVNDVAWSMDGVHIASGSADKTVKVWHAMTGNCVSTLRGHMLSVAAVSFSDDALRLASGSWDKTVCIWDVELGKALITLTGHSDWVHAVSWAPGGRQLASASSDHTVRIWNAITGVVEQVLVGHLQTVTSVSFARNGVFLASGSLDRTVRVWNVQEGTLAARLQQESDEGSVHTVAFVPDSERIVVGSGDRLVKVWNVRTGSQEEQLHGHEDAVRMVCVSTDGSRIISCSHDSTVRVWRMLQRRAAPALTAAAAALSGAQTPTARNGGPGRGATAASFQELHERLRSTEDTNQHLRKQLSEAQLELENNNWQMRNFSSSREEQERELHNYREMISSLTAEKERLERSFTDMRRELRALPTAAAGCAVGGCGGGSQVGTALSGCGGYPRTELSADQRSVPPRVHHAAGTPGAPGAGGHFEDQQHDSRGSHLTMNWGTPVHGEASPWTRLPQSMGRAPAG
mmetsp:Transcript_80824/g.227591  ORF Transcript_80824/g.227591 Transcript_80824/m.227591 type:complete len:715 (-) Transcript_80824:236-2380(-)